MIAVPRNSDIQSITPREMQLRILLPKLAIALVVSFFVCSLETAEAEKEFGPWSSTKASPRASSVDVSTEDAESGGYVSSVCFGWLSIYQHHMGVVMRSQCPMIPSCSAYSIEAIRKHGALKGLVLTFDRLIHEADEKATGYRVMQGHRFKVLDTLTNNDFWWYE